MVDVLERDEKVEFQFQLDSFENTSFAVIFFSANNFIEFQIYTFGP